MQALSDNCSMDKMEITASDEPQSARSQTSQGYYDRVPSCYCIRWCLSVYTFPKRNIAEPDGSLLVQDRRRKTADEIGLHTHTHTFCTVPTHTHIVPTHRHAHIRGQRRQTNRRFRRYRWAGLRVLSCPPSSLSGQRAADGKSQWRELACDLPVNPLTHGNSSLASPTLAAISPTSPQSNTTSHDTALLLRLFDPVETKDKLRRGAFPQPAARDGVGLAAS